jgi:hypothetical protein
MWSSLFCVFCIVCLICVCNIYRVSNVRAVWYSHYCCVCFSSLPPPQGFKQQCPTIVNCLILTANDLLSLPQVWAEWWCDHSDVCTYCPCSHGNYRLCSTQGDLTRRGLGCGTVYLVGWYKCSVLNVVMLGSSETLITTYHTVWCCNWENHNLNLHCHGDLEFHKARFSSFTLCRML